MKGPTMTRTELDALHAAATPGEWEYEQRNMPATPIPGSRSP